jgi:hypothetical protein
MRFQDFLISFNKVDSDLDFSYKEEVKELKKRVLWEFNTLSNENAKKTMTLDANQVMNAVYSAELLFSILGFQSKSLLERKKEPIDLKEYEVFSSFHWFVFLHMQSYRCDKASCLISFANWVAQQVDIIS